MAALPPRPWTLEAHAIVSREGAIADAQGQMPEGLFNAVDQRRFQGLLDGAAAGVLGRHGHERHPRRAHRRRLVVTSTVADLERDGSHVVLWNPNGAPHEEALQRVAPGGGIVVVTGGARVFALFLDHGLDRFDLAIAQDCSIIGGIPCLPDVAGLTALVQQFENAGLSLETSEWLDADARIELQRYRA